MTSRVTVSTGIGAFGDTRVSLEANVAATASREEQEAGQDDLILATCAITGAHTPLAVCERVAARRQKETGSG